MKKKSLFLGVLLLSYFQPLYSVIASESPTSGSSSILSSSENPISNTNSDPLSNIHTVDTNNTTTDHVTNTKKDNEESINDESTLNKSDSESKDNPEKSIEEKTPNSETVSSTTETSANSDETNSKVNENQMVKPPEEAQVNKMAVTTGTWGTAPYTWDDSSGVLTIGAGDLQQVDLAPYNSGSIDKDNIKKIIFTGRVIAPVDSSNLFSLFNLSSIDGLTNLDTSNVTTMNSMFSSTTKLTSLDLSSFNTSNVTTMSYMFSSTGLISLNLSNFNTSKVTDMYSMFSTLINLTSLDLSSFNTSNVTNMGDMFSGEYSSTSLTSLNLSSFNNSKVMNMNRMFTNTVKLQSLTLGKNFKFLVSGGGNPDIPTITPNNKYTGLWKNVGTGTEDIPKGANLWNSLDFQKYYNGNTDADTYVWQQFSAPITVNYVDEKGKTILTPQILKGISGDTYDATTNKYKLDVAGYTLDTSKLPKNGTGSFTDKEQTVTYVYKANTGGAAVTVNYVDEKGKTILTPQILKGNIGDTYDATTTKYKLDVAGYTLDISKLPKNGTGSFTDKEQTVTYVYKANAEGAVITVNYVDEKGKTIHDPQILKGNIGDTYDATTNKYKLDVAGYTLDTSKLPKNGTGIFTDKEQTVTYVYKANAEGAVITVNYVDEKGKTIHDPQILKGNIGDTYDATTNKYKLDVAGYTLDTSKLPKNGTGIFTDKEQTVTYVYKANAEGAVITVNYVDEKGKTIHDPQILKGNIGDTYDATTNKYKLDVAGYTLDTSKLPKNGTGSFTDKEQTVTYVYKANAEGAVITVNYVDEKGKTIHDPQILKGNIGDTYDATTNKYKLDVAGYTLDTSKLPKNGTGIFTDKEQTVTYVYKANAEGAVITVNYVDEKGKTIHDPQILKGNIGDTYDATTNKYKLDVAGYTLDTSKLPKNGTGSFTDKEQTVTYVYKANAEGAVITVNYVDEKGKTIHDPQILKGNIGDTYDATTNKYKLDVAGYTLDTSKLPKNGTGSFTDKEQTVTYVYKNNSIIPNSKSNNQNKDVFTNYEGKTTVKNKKYLPHTGEDKISAFVTLVLGYFILIGTTFILIYKRKKQNKK